MTTETNQDTLWQPSISGLPATDPGNLDILAIRRRGLYRGKGTSTMLTPLSVEGVEGTDGIYYVMGN